MNPLSSQINIKRFSDIDMMKGKIIVDENKFLNTYTKYQQQLVKEFLDAGELKKIGIYKK